MADLSAPRRDEIATIQRTLKPEDRSRLRYTYDTAAVFVVSLPGARTGVDGYNLASCATPDPDFGEHCVHSCAGLFNEQTWEAAPMSADGSGRCLDTKPIWYRPHEPLPKLAVYPIAGND